MADSGQGLCNDSIEEQSSFLNGFRIASININGLVSREDTRKQLKYWIEIEEIDIICIQEWYLHHPDSPPIFPEADFPGYSLAKFNDKTAILYRDTLSIHSYKDISTQSNGQSTTWISVYAENRVVNIASYYQSTF